MDKVPTIIEDRVHTTSVGDIPVVENTGTGNHYCRKHPDVIEEDGMEEPSNYLSVTVDVTVINKDVDPEAVTSDYVLDDGNPTISNPVPKQGN